MPGPGLLALAAAALVALIVLRRALRHIRRIQLDPVSAHWLGEQKRR